MEDQSMWLGMLRPWIGPILMFALFAPGFYFAKIWNDKYPDNRVKKFFLWRPKNWYQMIAFMFIPNIFILAMTWWYMKDS